MKWATLDERGAYDWLMRPVMANLCRYESLKDGTLGLEDIAIMNNALDVRETNEILAREASE